MRRHTMNFDIKAYHSETKHHLHKFARSSGYLDWATQPHPFRYYKDAPVIRLRRNIALTGAAYDNLYTSGAVEPVAISRDSIADFLRHSLGLSAWKQYGASKWALRVNPSSGNLHPTEAYIISGPIDDLTDTPGLFHYVSESHALERRADIAIESWKQFKHCLPDEAFLLGISSIPWREAWKYGERAFRYCQHDVGHALAALRMAAVCLGWEVRIVPHISDKALNHVMGLDRVNDFHPEEREEADCLLLVSPTRISDAQLVSIDDDQIGILQATEFHGAANQLSSGHVAWDIIDRAIEASQKPEERIKIARHSYNNTNKTMPQKTSQVDARQIILRRRSATAMDGKSHMTLDAFASLMRRLIPGEHPPWDMLFWPPLVTPVIFVHRVENLAPGLYVLIRNEAQLARMRGAIEKQYVWEQPSLVSNDLPLYLLAEGDLTEIAAGISCRQDIAGDGFFSLGMLADMERGLVDYGQWFYRHLFWECGIIGQILYLEAEVAGARGTGIGCYFDDAVHHILDLTGERFQSLYHFTVGMPVEDSRLTTLPPYE